MAEAGAAASQAEDPQSPCLVPASGADGVCNLMSDVTACGGRTSRKHVPQHEPHWVKIHPSVGIHPYPACLGLAGG